MIIKKSLFVFLVTVCLTACNQPAPQNGASDLPVSPTVLSPEDASPASTQPRSTDSSASTPESFSPSEVTPTRDCEPKTYYPPTMAGELAPAAPGTTIEVMGRGGYYRDSCGGYDESAMSFTLYFDQEPVGEFICYASLCGALWTIPVDTPPGKYRVSVEGVGALWLEVLAEE